MPEQIDGFQPALRASEQPAKLQQKPTDSGKAHRAPPPKNGRKLHEERQEAAGGESRLAAVTVSSHSCG